jgi:hypothetical protein
LIKFNDFKNKIMMYSGSDFLGKDIMINLIMEFKQSRHDLKNMLIDIGYEEEFLDQLLETINDKLKSNIYLKSYIYNENNINKLISDHNYKVI